MGLPLSDAEMLTDTREMADYFEAVCQAGANAKLAANLIITEVRRVLNEEGMSIDRFPVEPRPD